MGETYLEHVPAQRMKFCKRCDDHTARYKNGACKACMRMHQKIYRTKHLEMIKAKDKAYREANRIKLAARTRAYYLEHKDIAVIRKRASRKRLRDRLEQLEADKEELLTACEAVSWNADPRTRMKQWCALQRMIRIFREGTSGSPAAAASEHPAGSVADRLATDPEQEDQQDAPDDLGRQT